MTHGQPTLADVGESSIFHGSADVGWVWESTPNIGLM